MYEIKVDPHLHTILSGHAYSTYEECAYHAAEKGLKGIAITDHFGPMFVEDNRLMGMVIAFANMRVMPDYINGVRVLRGVELDIVDLEGNLFGHDMPSPFDPKINVRDIILDTREVAIASLHYFDGYKDGTILQNTDMYCKALETPGVHIIGHMDRGGIDFDIDTILKVAKAEGKIIEINNASLTGGAGSEELCRGIAEKCAELGVYISVSSDAHSAFAIGDFDKALEMLCDMDFPEELIANKSLERFIEIISYIR